MERIFEALRLSHRLLHLADSGEEAAEDDGCRILYGLVRDCGYRIQALAEREIQVHEGQTGHSPIFQALPTDMESAPSSAEGDRAGRGPPR